MNINPGFVLFLAFFLIVGGMMLYRVLKFGGFRAAMFGAPIERTVGEAAGANSRMGTFTVKVHRLGGGADRAVGLELVVKTFTSYQMMPVTLSAVEAQKLAQLLQSAATGAASTGQPR